MNALAWAAGRAAAEQPITFRKPIRWDVTRQLGASPMPRSPKPLTGLAAAKVRSEIVRTLLFAILAGALQHLLWSDYRNPKLYILLTESFYLLNNNIIIIE